MNFETTLGEAFANTDVQAIVGALREEKAFKSLVNRLDKICSKELDRNEFKNICLVLRAVESLCESDEQAVHSFVQQGLVVKITSGFLRMEELKLAKGLANLIEEFYDVSMSICRMSWEGKGQIQDVFVLRFGTLVIDANISFSLRLEAIRTINSILDRATKERKKFTLSEDHCLLLQEFANVVLSVGDYEMQVAVSEALCRMTVKKSREELVYKWFSNPTFGDSFKTINDREFETDCRKFLNEVNNSFGDERRVVTFPCVKAFLDLTELFMPDDKNLDQFWIDFNIGTSCVSFFVNDPEGTLWESINLPKAAVSGYNVLGCDEQKILTVQMAIPIAHSKAKGKSVQIIFDAKYDIENAVKRAFGEEKLWQRVQSEEQPALVISEPPAQEFQNVLEAAPCHSTSRTTEQADVVPVGQRDKSEATPLPEREGAFQLEEHSDTEVARAKARLFSQSTSSNGSTLSTPVAGAKQKESQKVWRSKVASESDSSVSQGERGVQRRGSDRLDYSRKKPKTKAALKILPLSSASSAEEPELVKHSTPTLKSLEREEQGESSKRMPQASKDQSLDVSAIPTLPGFDSGFPEEIMLDNSGFSTVGRDKTSTKDPKSSSVTPSPLAMKRKNEFSAPVFGLVPTKRQVPQEEGQLDPGLKPRQLFPSSPPKTTTGKATTMLPEDTESETEMGSSVFSAFQTFKNQLREHFSSRYKKIESRSLKSLTDCQNHVTSLLSTVHRHRLLHLERFQATMVNELNNLENDCLSLKDIEKETVNFWRTESHAVASFCDKQQKRLQSLELLRKDSQSEMAQEEAVASSQTTPQEMPTGGNSINNAH